MTVELLSSQQGNHANSHNDVPERNRLSRRERHISYHQLARWYQEVAVLKTECPCCTTNLSCHVAKAQCASDCSRIAPVALRVLQALISYPFGEVLCSAGKPLTPALPGGERRVRSSKGQSATVTQRRAPSGISPRELPQVSPSCKGRPESGAR